jgi:hypothetical protein
VMSDKEVTGHCLCGSIRFTAQLPSMYCVHCHCSMCRRNHGAAYVTWFSVPRGKVKLEAGGEDLVRFMSSEHGSRSFCRRCGTSLFCENDAHPDRTDIPLGTVDGPIDRQPQAHVFFDSGADWVAIGDELPRLGGKTGMEPLKEG